MHHFVQIAWRCILAGVALIVLCHRYAIPVCANCGTSTVNEEGGICDECVK